MARERLRVKEIVNVEYHRGDATSLAVDRESFDVVFLVAVLGAVPDRHGALREIGRVLGPTDCSLS